MVYSRVIFAITLTLKALWFYNYVWVARCNSSLFDCLLYTITGKSTGLITEAMKCFSLSLLDMLCICLPNFAILKIMLLAHFQGLTMNFAAIVDWVSGIVLLILAIQRLFRGPEVNLAQVRKEAQAEAHLEHAQEALKLLKSRYERLADKKERRSVEKNNLARLTQDLISRSQNKSFIPHNPAARHKRASTPAYPDYDRLLESSFLGTEQDEFKKNFLGLKNKKKAPPTKTLLDYFGQPKPR